MKLLACGGRHFGELGPEKRLMERVLLQVHTGGWTFGDLRLEGPISLLINGGARGADQFCHNWALKQGVPLKRFMADWIGDGDKLGGRIRNQKMLDFGPDLVVAFPGGKGTAHMVRQTKKAGVPLIHISSDHLENTLEGKTWNIGYWGLQLRIGGPIT